LLLLAYGGTGLVALIGSILCGLGLGAHAGLLAFFASRYFGLRAYGKIYGTMFGLFLFGSGIGPFLGNLSYDLWRSYSPALVACAGILIAVSMLFARLGPYRFVSQPSVCSRAPGIARSAAMLGRPFPVEGGVPCRD
jgi:MFS family permease